MTYVPRHLPLSNYIGSDWLIGSVSACRVVPMFESPESTVREVQ